MDVREVRRENLRKLNGCFESQRLFADAADVSESVAYQILSGRRNIGEKLARKLEGKLKIPSGWLDLLHESVVLPIGINYKADNISSADVQHKNLDKQGQENMLIDLLKQAFFVKNEKVLSMMIELSFYETARSKRDSIDRLESFFKQLKNEVEEIEPESKLIEHKTM